ELPRCEAVFRSRHRCRQGSVVRAQRGTPRTLNCWLNCGGQSPWIPACAGMTEIRISRARDDGNLTPFVLGEDGLRKADVSCRVARQSSAQSIGADRHPSSPRRRGPMDIELSVELWRVKSMDPRLRGDEGIRLTSARGDGS